MSVGVCDMEAEITAEARLAARMVLTACGINSDGSEDFSALSSSQVDSLLEYADRLQYKAPLKASGSRGRCFYEALQYHVYRAPAYPIAKRRKL